MSLVIKDRTCFSGFCPCLYYNAVLGHVKQDWLCQPCLACILLITFPIFLRRKFPAENGRVGAPLTVVHPSQNSGRAAFPHPALCETNRSHYHSYILTYIRGLTSG